jgi:hypothetical protein
MSNKNKPTDEEKFKYLESKYPILNLKAFENTIAPLPMIYTFIGLDWAYYEDGKIFVKDLKRKDYELAVFRKDCEFSFGKVKKTGKGSYIYNYDRVLNKDIYTVDMICKKGMKINNEVKRKLRKFEGVKKVERIYDIDEFSYVTDKIRDLWKVKRIKENKIINNKHFRKNLLIDKMSIKACYDYFKPEDIYMRLYYNNDEVFGFSFDIAYADVLYGVESKTLDYTKYDNTYLYNYLIETSPKEYIEMGMYDFGRPSVGKFKENFTYGIFPYYMDQFEVKLKDVTKVKEVVKNVDEWFV